MTAIRFSVNGKPHAEESDLERPLLFYLRDELALTGTKYGCGMGLCGACRVIVNGRAVNSCDTPLWSIDGASVTTIEGLSQAQTPHPVQQALADASAGQCGFCMPGIVVTLAAAMGADHAASKEHLMAALDSNLCRCGSHPRIDRAVGALASGRYGTPQTRNAHEEHP